MTKQPSDEDRFAQLVKDEFGVAVEGPVITEDSVHRKPPHQLLWRRQIKVPTEQVNRWFSLDDALNQAEPDDEPFEPPPAPPIMHPRSRMVMVGLVLFAFSVVIFILTLARIDLPSWLRIVGWLAIGAGLVVMLMALPKHHNPYEEPEPLV